MHSARRIVAVVVVAVLTIGFMIDCRPHKPIHGQTNQPGVMQGFALLETLTGAYEPSTPKCASGSVTSTTATFSANISGMGFSVITDAQVMALSTGTTAATTFIANPTTVSTTAISGTMMTGTTLGILGATIIPATSSTTVYIHVCGY